MTEELEAKMLCPYCDAQFTPRMLIDYYLISEGCDTCGCGREVSNTVTIYCDNCYKLVYKKEYRGE